jgi:hypothetical protein
LNQKTERTGKEDICRMHGILIPEQALIYKEYGKRDLGRHKKRWRES